MKLINFDFRETHINIEVSYIKNFLKSSQLKDIDEL